MVMHTVTHIEVAIMHSVWYKPRLILGHEYDFTILKQKS